MVTLRIASVLVADAEAVGRMGLSALINSHDRLRVCAEAETVPMARELCARERPDVLVLDPEMGDGLSLIKDLPRWSTGTRVVAFTRLADAVSVQRVIHAGASGFVNRRDPAQALLDAILRVADGGQYVTPSVEQMVVEHFLCGRMELRGHPTSELSDRELEVFQMLGRGMRTRAMAEELRVSVKTVETHRQRIKLKLGLRDGNELQRQAVLFIGATESALFGKNG